ncbi:hypothetical protein Taro_016659 [Colocasia esculenta]|uniref:Glycosyl transferase family 1 domain-containing protein n=1 Tax=Colocasia esculenta TaxID=4460 RepID=A0A843UTK4_COLES|nr:hypothetical protein [Colocasia esculenta]
MGANRPRDGSEGFQHQGAGGVTKRYQPRHFVDEASRSSDRQGAARHGIFRGGGGGGRRALAIARLVLLCCMAACAAGGFVLLAVWLHSSTDDGAVGNWGGSGWSRGAGRGRRAGEVLRFAPADLLRRFDEQGGIDGIRSEPRLGVRPPRLAIVLGRMQKDSSSLLLLTLAKSLKELSYNLTVFAVNGGEAHPHWELVGGRVYMLDRDNYIDWSIFEGVILSSLEARVAISSLVQEPFDHVPLIWIVLEDTLGERLPLYMETGWQLIVSEWRKAFSRADVLVFPDFSLPLLYTVLDTGNFFVVPGSPVDVWAAESYLMSHSKVQSRRDNGFHEHDLVVTVVGSSFNFHELPWDCVAAMRLIGPQLVEFAKTNYLGKSLKVVVLTGNSTNGHSSAFQDIAAQLGFCDGCIKHYGLDGDINRVLLIADIVLYGSFHEEQSFPSLLVRAMSFGIPVIAPDLAVIKKYVTNGVDGFIFQVRDLKSLNTAFSLAVVELNLPAQDRTIGTSGKLLSKNMLAWDCITGYAKLLENVLQFPSETILPSSITQIQQHTWEWNLFGEETEKIRNQVQHQIFNEDGTSMGTSSIVYIIEEELADKNTSEDPFMHQNETYVFDHLNELDWEDVREIEFYEDIERQEMEELAERTEGPLAKWEDIYSKTRKVLKMKFGVNEREEEELEKVGRHVCIYEIYDGAGAWPFLHHGALYRGLSLVSFSIVFL